MSEGDGLVLFRKPAGVTSFSSLASLKRRLKTGKIGHTGTLDKFAEGLLVVLVGKYTRLASFLSEQDKRYLAEIEFGKETDTLDPEGTVLFEAPVPNLETIEEKSRCFIGQIEQRPPEFSAVHIDGERASKRMRRGEQPEMPSRTVHVKSFTLLSWEAPVLTADIACGKGTYIRSLARDLGRACGSRAYVRKLLRTEVGPFSLNEAIEPDDLEKQDFVIKGSEAFRKFGLECILKVKNQFLDRLKQGKKIEKSFFTEEPKGKGPFLVFSEADELIAFIEESEGAYRYKFVAA